MATPTSLPSSFTAGNVLLASQLNDLRGAFRVLQVVSTTKTNKFTTTSTSYVTVTDLTATITPSSTSSKILVFGGVSFSTLTQNSALVALYRGSTAIVAEFGYQEFVAYNLNSAPFVYLDSPNTTSATTYEVRARISSSTTAQVNARGTDGSVNGASFITVMEISA